MGSTLTNTQPKDTYKSLLKTSDSTELSATAKYVSDGNGNDSPLALSNAAVGIGTTSPARPLSVGGIGKFTRTLTLGANDGTTSFGVYMANEAFASNLDTTQFTIGTASGSNIPIIFAINATERVRVTTDGLTFNGDTASANALNDYETGTFTPTTAGDATGAFSATRGEYTKIGNVVHFRLIAQISSNFTDNFIGGLPFTVGGLNVPSGISGNINVANNSDSTLTANIECNATTVRFYSGNSTATQVPPSTTMGILRMFGTYRV